MPDYIVPHTSAILQERLNVGDTPAKVVNERDKSLKMMLGDVDSATLIKKSDSEEKFAFNFYVEGDKKDKLIILAGGFRIRAKTELQYFKN